MSYIVGYGILGIILYLAILILENTWNESVLEKEDMQDIVIELVACIVLWPILLYQLAGDIKNGTLKNRTS